MNAEESPKVTIYPGEKTMHPHPPSVALQGRGEYLMHATFAVL